MTVQQLITENLDIWTAAHKTRSSAGRGSSNKLELVGIKKLRELILELAVRGKLVPQDPNDEPASELLKKIAGKRDKLISEGQIRKEKSAKFKNVSAESFCLPAGWEQANLHELAPMSLIDGDWIESKDQDPNGDVRLVQLADVGVDEFKDVSDRYINSNTFVKLNCSEIKAGDILIARLPNPIGRACIFPGLKQKSITVVDVAILRPLGYAFDRYLVHCINSLSFREQVESFGKGATRFRISTGNLKQIKVPVAPIAEQHRIVAKVDELMAFCDQLEQTQNDNIEAHAKLVEALLATLTNSTDHKDLQNNWQRIATHFDTLFTTEHSIDQLKQTILQLAVMGKLVPQNPNDEPASILLKKIAKEKVQLIKEGKIKKQKPLPAIAEEEKPFELPSGWSYIRFGAFSSEIATGPFGSMIHKSDYIENGVPLINPSHMINGKIVEDNAVTVSLKKAEELSSYIISKGDIVMARRGEMGRCAEVTSREANWLCGTGSFVLKFYRDLSRPFILLIFNTQWVKDYLGGESVGTTMTNLNHGILNKMPLLLPPLEEQHRIVAKVEELMTLCDTLKTNLQNAQTTQLALAENLVSMATGNDNRPNTKNSQKVVSMKIVTDLVLKESENFGPDAILANILKAEGGAADAKTAWRKSKLDLPAFYKQLKKEISAGYIVKPKPASF